MAYHHLSVEERELIQQGLWEKKSCRAIAKELNRDPSSISREVAKNLPPQHFQYAPRLAHERALKNRKRRGRTERLKNDAVRDHVIFHLRKRWSPEQIAATAQYAAGTSISHEAIYQFVYARVSKASGLMYGNQEDFRPCLRRRRKRRIPKGARRCQRIKPYGISIDARPPVVAAKKRFGDWEGDTVESRRHLPGVNTLLERKSGMVFLTKLRGKDADATLCAVRERLISLPPRLRRTLTLDNGPENSGWRRIEAATGTRCFFAHPYHAWERGANENANGLVRDYFPKGTDFRMIPNTTLRFVERELNQRPRKRLGWKTPEEFFRDALRG